MKLFSQFGIGSDKILAMGCHVKGTVTIPPSLWGGLLGLFTGHRLSPLYPLSASSISFMLCIRASMPPIRKSDMGLNNNNNSTRPTRIFI